MQLFNESLDIFEMAGWISIPLILSSSLLCYTIYQRFLILRRHTKLSVRGVITRAKFPNHALRGVLFRAAQSALKHLDIGNHNKRKRILDEEIKLIEGDISAYRSMIETLVATAPLLGLLGTVMGMIETFESLGDMTLFTQTGGIAGGISQALITTQMGLIIAIPGLLCDRFLKTMESKRRDEIVQIKDIVCQM